MPAITPDPRPNFDLEAALADAERRYAERRPRSRAHIERASRSMPGGNTRSVLYFKPFPFVVRDSAGCRLSDLDDHDYVDFLGEYTAGLFGHSDPTIKTGIREALDSGWVLGGHIENEAILAEVLCARFPSLESVRFTNSGTQANLMALVTARVFTKRQKIMVFRGGYHGGVLLYKAGNAPQNVPFPIVFGRYNDVDATLAAIREHARDLAAVIVEPMQGSAGCIPAEPAFLQALREACSHHGIVLVFDEVMTSRLSPGGVQQALGITPDLTTLGKYIGGGAPFGAFGGRLDLMGLYDPSRQDALAHAGTFNNNVITMAAGVAAMTKVLTSDRIDRINASGETLRSRLNELVERRSLPVQFTGRGSMMNIHFRNGAI